MRHAIGERIVVNPISVCFLPGGLLHGTGGLSASGMLLEAVAGLNLGELGVRPSLIGKRSSVLRCEKNSQTW
jgi:hypothetical protein